MMLTVHKIKDAWRHGKVAVVLFLDMQVLWIYQYIPLFLIYLSLYYFSDIFLPAIIYIILFRNYRYISYISHIEYAS